LSAPPTATEMARLTAELAADRKATDILLLQLSELSSITDYFVICTGRSDIQVRAICQRVREGMKEAGHSTLSVEGVENGHWGLLDFGEVVVHVFLAETRELYGLERLWADAPRWTYESGSAIEQTRA
jgi:ribosome-associated protein